MKYLYQNGIEYHECENLHEKKNELCSDCQEKRFEHFMGEFYGGSNFKDRKAPNDSKKPLKLTKISDKVYFGVIK